MLIDNQAKIWIGARQDIPSSFWQMPQGGIDAGEDAKTALLRELWEEIGLRETDIQIIGQGKKWISYDFPSHLSSKVWQGRYKGQKQKWFLLKLISQASNINVHTENPEFSEGKWVIAQDILSHVVPFKRNVYKQVLDEFLPLIHKHTNQL